MRTHGWSASSSPTTSRVEQSIKFVTRYLTPWSQKTSSSAAVLCSGWHGAGNSLTKHCDCDSKKVLLCCWIIHSHFHYSFKFSDTERHCIVIYAFSWICWNVFFLNMPRMTTRLQNKAIFCVEKPKFSFPLQGISVVTRRCRSVFCTRHLALCYSLTIPSWV